jgi:hypothetical protein
MSQKVYIFRDKGVFSVWGIFDTKAHKLTKKASGCKIIATNKKIIFGGKNGIFSENNR